MTFLRDGTWCILVLFRSVWNGMTPPAPPPASTQISGSIAGGGAEKEKKQSSCFQPDWLFWPALHIGKAINTVLPQKPNILKPSRYFSQDAT